VSVATASGGDVLVTGGLDVPLCHATFAFFWMFVKLVRSGVASRGLLKGGYSSFA